MTPSPHTDDAGAEALKDAAWCANLRGSDLSRGKTMDGILRRLEKYARHYAAHHARGEG